MNDWTPLIVALIAALPGLYALISQSRKDNAEAVDAISQAAAQLVGPLKVENKELRERLAALEAENQKLKAENERLEQQFCELRELLHLVLKGCTLLSDQLEALGHKPVFNPGAVLGDDDLISWKGDGPGGEP
jgi:chromosome segregation ATPase